MNGSETVLRVPSMPSHTKMDSKDIEGDCCAVYLSVRNEGSNHSLGNVPYSSIISQELHRATATLKPSQRARV